MNEFYLLFASQMQADNQIEAIIKACAVTRRHDDLIAKHSKDAAEIKAFLAEKSAFYADFSYGGSTDSIREQLMAFYEYRNATKPPMAGHIIECGGTLNSLRSSCKANMRPIYEPHAEFQPDVIEAGWSELESVENDHEIKLRDFYRKFQEVDFAAKKFSVRADKFDRWAQEKSVVFEEADFGTGTVGAEICQNSFEIYEGQLAKFKQAASEMEEAATTCEAVPEHESSASVVDRNKLCQQKLSELESAGIAYKAALDKKLELEIRKAELKKTVAKDGAIALYDAENLEETIMEPIVAGQVAAIQEKIDELEGPIAAEVEDLNARIANLRRNMNELEQLNEGGDASESKDADGAPQLKRGSSLHVNSALVALVTADDSRLNDLRGSRVGELSTLLSDEESREAARKLFADAAQAVSKDLAGKTKELGSLEGEPEEQITTLEAMAKAHAESKTMEPAEEAASKCDDLGVVINPYTPETIFTLRSQWDEVGKAYKQARNVAEKAVMDKAGSELTPEQVAEIREVFDYFDEDKDGALTLKEFQDGCQGLGMVMDAATTEGHFHSIGGGIPLNFDQFSTFMVDQMKTGTSLEDVIAAFRSLASGESITEDAVNQHFGPREDYADYLLTNMPTAEDGSRDYVAFTHALFSR